MQFYSRTTRAAAGSVPPATSFAPDGQLRLAVPVRTAAAPSDAPDRVTPAVGAGSLNGGGSDSLVMMLPQTRPDEISAPRVWFLMALACDAAVLLACLLELRWRRVYFASTLGTGLAGLALCAIGTASCHYRAPAMLGVFAVAAFAQFCANVLLLQSIPQVMHTLLQPVLMRYALLLRRQRTPPSPTCACCL